MSDQRRLPPATGFPAKQSRHFGIPLHMSEAEGAFYLEAIRDKDCVIEFGTGGSTALAFKCGVWRLHAVDTDMAFARNVVATHNLSGFMETGRLFVHHAYIGPTRAWGMPKGEDHKALWSRYHDHTWSLLPREAQVVLVDGRFRAATALSAALYVPSALVVIHDFWSRPFYEPVLKAFDVEHRIDDLVSLRRRPAVPDSEILEIRQSVEDEPR